MWSDFMWIMVKINVPDMYSWSEKKPIKKCKYCELNDQTCTCSSVDTDTYNFLKVE